MKVHSTAGGQYVFRSEAGINTEREKAHVANGDWKEHDIDNTNEKLIDLALKGDCVAVDGRVIAKPTEECSDYIAVEK